MHFHSPGDSTFLRVYRYAQSPSLVHELAEGRCHLGSGYNYDSTSIRLHAIRPRYDHSTTYVTTVYYRMCMGCCTEACK